VAASEKEPWAATDKATVFVGPFDDFQISGRGRFDRIVYNRFLHDFASFDAAIARRTSFSW
jgi:hypothetical protein